MKFIVFFYHTTLFRCNQELIRLKEMYLHFCFFFLSPISCQYMKILYQHISKIIASMQEKRIWRTQWQPKIYCFAEAMFSWQYNHKEQNAFSWDSFSLALYPDISRAEGGRHSAHRAEDTIEQSPSSIRSSDRLLWRCDWPRKFQFQVNSNPFVSGKIKRKLNWIWIWIWRRI